MLALAELAQRKVNTKENQFRKFTISNDDLDYLLRGLADAIDHLSPQLPQGVFEYIERITPVLEQAIIYATTKED